MLVYIYNTHLFYATRLQTSSLVYIADCHRHCTRFILIYKQHGEKGNVGVVRERERTADDRWIKAELHPSQQAGRRATVHPSRLLLMTWASKNWQLLSHPVCIQRRHHVCSIDRPWDNDRHSTSFAQRMACWPPRVMQFNDYLMTKTDYKTTRFLVYMYYTHSAILTSWQKELSHSAEKLALSRWILLPFEPLPFHRYHLSRGDCW